MPYTQISPGSRDEIATGFVTGTEASKRIRVARRLDPERIAVAVSHRIAGPLGRDLPALFGRLDAKEDL